MEELTARGYRIPTRDEFVEGFEYEFYIAGSGNEYEKRIFTTEEIPGEISQARLVNNIYHLDLQSAWIRVKTTDFAKRRSGRTTRLVDYYIQKLFTTGEIKIKDHHDTEQAHKLIFNKIRRRLSEEHRGVLDNMEVDIWTMTIKRKE